jgi:hypothetical protein
VSCVASLAKDIGRDHSDFARHGRVAGCVYLSRCMPHAIGHHVRVFISSDVVSSVLMV